MKLLFVGTNPENTGAASHFVALIQAMAEAGHEVSVVVYPDGLICHGLAQSHVRLYKAKFRNVLDLRGYAAVFRAARDLKPDWLVGNFGKEYWPLILAGRLLRVQVALFRHRAPPMKRFSAYLIPRLAQRFFAVSQHARQAYLDRGTPGHLVRVLYNPVNMELCRFDPQQRSEILRSLGISEDAIVLGYTGRMHDGKGIFPLFEATTAAMTVEPRLHCLWLGDGPDAQTLRDRAAAHPMAARHHFLGWIHDVHPYYSAFSMLAFPSIATETFGRVSVEAQAAGVPVLGSDIGGIPETLRVGATGLLLPPDDAPAWREAILKLCDPSLRKSMGMAAHQYVQQRFSTHVIAREFQRLLVEG
ncbi:glycosyltransferase family 4 protein [Rhodanobacter sp. C05]|uniref:glycosyltransferase family 4 protein n=1 Tax=Rhodanobacter sp. C05 TaxID=1945855 RepID=UPI0009843583|nr:glycosyltransferase family 4 protein [Rhodanobacter sp. C05]OOG40367.1 glycosyl transferase family 1 [Rhodanobacter sp. C05]